MALAITAPATTPVRIFPAVAHSRSPAAACCMPPTRSAAVARVAINVFIKYLLLFRLSTPIHKYNHVCCVDFRFWRGATREHPPQWGAVTEEQRNQNRKATQPSGRRFFSAQTSLLAPYRPLEGMRVARASSGPKTPRRKRDGIYEMGYLGARLEESFAVSQ